MSARWFETLISVDMYLKRSPGWTGWQHFFRLKATQHVYMECLLQRGRTICRICIHTAYPS